MATNILRDVCMLCFKSEYSMGIIVCSAHDVKLRDQIFRATQYQVPELPAILCPVCDGCRSRIVQCDHVPQITSLAAESKTQTVLLNVESIDPLAIPEGVQQLHQSNYVPAEKWRTYFTSDPMQIFQHMCELCGTVDRSMEKHVAQHQAGDGKFRCIFCEMSFVTKPLLECHISGHNKKLFVCHLCGQAYRTIILLKSHMIRSRCNANHGKRRSKVYRCTGCGKTFFSNYKRLKHQDQHEKRRLYECFVCRSMFPSLEYLQAHRRKHAVDRGAIKYGEISTDECGRIDSNTMNGSDLKNADYQKDRTTEIQQQAIPAPESLLPTNDATEVTESTSDNSVCMEENQPIEKSLNIMRSDLIAPANDATEVTESTSDNTVCMDENQTIEKSLNTMRSDLIAPTNDPIVSKENKCLSESSTIDRTKHNHQPTFTEIPKTSESDKSITILEVIDLPRLPRPQIVNGPIITGPTESPINSEESATPPSPKPDDDPPTSSVCEDLEHQPTLLKLEILPAWESHGKINPELWSILGVPTALSLSLKRKDTSPSMTKHKEKHQIDQGFKNRLLQLPPCLKKDCNCDEFIRCLYVQ